MKVYPLLIIKLIILVKIDGAPIDSDENSTISLEYSNNSTIIDYTTSEEQETTITTTVIPSTILILPTEIPFEDSDQAIKNLPGYWIKRAGTEEEDIHEGEASFIDYRTEMYQIADLFPSEEDENIKENKEEISDSFSPEDNENTTKEEIEEKERKYDIAFDFFHIESPSRVDEKRLKSTIFFRCGKSKTEKTKNKKSVSSIVV